MGENTNILSYNDVNDIGEWGIPAMQWTCGTGLINGNDNKLMPLDKSTRAQLASVLVRMSEMTAK